MFKRRKPRSLQEKFNELLWPKMGWRRLRDYYRHRMGRLPGTPYYIAAGLATGMAVSLTPFLGLHIFLGAAACWFLRASFVTMIFGTLIAGNPWSFPVIWVATYSLGHLMLGNEEALEAAAQEAGAGQGADVAQMIGAGLETAGDSGGLSLGMLFDKPLEFLLPMTLGSLPLIPIVWFGSFYICRRLVQNYKAARLARIRRRGAM